MKIAVIGAGKLGMRLTEALSDGDYEITLVDTDEEKLAAAATQYDVLTVTGDARSIELLEQIKVRTYDFLLSCTTSDDTNILVASFAKMLGCHKVAARVREPEYMDQMDFICSNLNIDRLINPDLLITSEIYRYLVEKYTLSNGIYTSDRIGLAELEASLFPGIVDKDLVSFRSTVPRMIVVGISRGGKMLIPRGDDRIRSDDILYLMGSKEDVLSLSKKAHKRQKNPELRKVMIIGGGKIGYYLAGRLAEYGSQVKIVEKDRKRCHYLSEHLNDVLVINGDGTDISLLEEEDIDEMDAFVTATGADEQNILLSMIAESHGIEDVISKISHGRYDNLISSLDLDMVLNPLDITVTRILNTLRGNKRVISSLLLQGQAELIELQVEDGMACTNIALKDLRLPDFIIVAAIYRGVDTIIPDGNTYIIPGDRVVVVCLASHAGFEEKLFKRRSLLHPDL